MNMNFSDFSSGGDSVQQEEFQLKHQNKTAQHLRFTVTNAFDHFIAVYKVSVNGTAVHGA